ncbi:response regulator [Reyranella sp.]|jgi:DNA-binding response OmpR family regulator|uniref:response regulator n=1 Tax=Reyranella sp. TaxID=1929291 RepID=UPI002F9233D0
MPSDDPGPGSRVLIVISDMQVRTTVADYLRECGSTVVEARDAEEALKLKRPTDYDAAFMELDIPGPMDGFSLAQAIRRERPGTPVVLTLDADHAERDAVKLSNVVRGLDRSFNQLALAQRLRRVRAARR